MNFNILVTNKCNLNCKYCYEKTKKMNELNFDLANKIIKFIETEIEIYNSKKVKILFHGGEPTLNFEIIKYLIENIEEKIKIKKYYEMTSNGFLISEEMKKYIYEKI